MAFGYRPPGAGYGPPPTRHSADRSSPALIGTANYQPPAPTPPRHQYGRTGPLPWYRTPGYQTGYGDTVDYNPEPQYAGGVGPAIAASDYAMGQAYASDPTLAGLQGLQAILGMRTAGYDQYLQGQMGYLNQNYAIDLAKQGLRLQGIDIDRAASGRDLEHLSLQEIIARQRHTLGMRGTNFDEQDINRQASGDMRRLDSDATARMAFTAPGVNEGRGEIRSAQQSAIDRLNTVTREGIHLDLNERLVGLWHQRDQVKDTSAKLDLAAKAVGLDRDSLKLQLEQGLARLSYDRVMNADQLIDGLFSTDASIRQRSLEIAGQIMAQGQAGQLPAPPTAGSQSTGTGGAYQGPAALTRSYGLGTSTTISDRDIYQAARAAGLDHNAAVIATAISLAESGGRPGAHNPRGEDSRGLWQINVAPNVRPNKWGDLSVPAANASAMYEISGGGTNWRPWSMYTNGGYQRYLGRANAAAG